MSNLRFVFPREFLPANQHARLLLSGCAHYKKSDLPMFISAYNELCRADLNGGRILELCCGEGELAKGVGLAFPDAEIVALDRYEESGRVFREAQARGELRNIRYYKGDALRLPEFADGWFDLIYGQATLHHLAHDTSAVGQEFSRLLKPGGRLVFIFEPLGHNPFFAMVRAYRTARAGMWDESNVVLAQLEEIARNFQSCEVQVFNLLGYGLKSFGRFAGQAFVRTIYRMDAAILRTSPRLAKLAANFNVIFTKAA